MLTPVDNLLILSALFGAAAGAFLMLVALGTVTYVASCQDDSFERKESMMPKMTGVQLMKLGRLHDEVDAAETAITQATASLDANSPLALRFAKAPAKSREDYTAAIEALTNYEAQLIEEGCAWRGRANGPLYSR